MADLIASQKTNESQAVANAPKKSEATGEAPAFEDKRPEAEMLRKQQEMIANTPPPVAKEDFEVIDRLEKDNIQKEQAVNPESKEQKEKLEALKKQGGTLGEDKQIALEGELTFSAKLNRFFNKESTYSIILRKTADFNKSTDIVEKQKLLKELKPLARTWLENHALSKDANEPNEVKKRVSLTKFLEQTTSNFPELIQSIKGFNDEWKARVLSSGNLLDDFTQFLAKYEKLKTDFETYKSTYPPGINLLYFDESAQLSTALQQCNTGETKSQDIGFAKHGFKLTAPIVSYAFETKNISYRGDVILTIPEAISSEGTIKGEFIEGKTALSIVKGISAKVKKGALAIACTNFTFSQSEGLVSSDVSASVNLYGTDYVLKSTYAKITEKSLIHEDLTGKAEFIDLKEHKTHILSAELVIEEKAKGLTISGMLDLVERSISMEQGLVKAIFNEQLTLEQLNFSRAKGRMNYKGQDFVLGGLGYDFAKNTVTIEYVEKSFEFSGYKVILAAKNGTIGLDNEVDARIFRGKLKGQIDTKKGVIITDPAITHDRGKAEEVGSTTFEGGLALSLENFSGSGEISATFSGSELKDLTIKKGIVDGTYEGIALKISDLKYLMDKGHMSADTVSATIKAFDKDITLRFTKALIDEKGFDFESISASLDSVDFGLLSVSNPTLTYNKAKELFYVNTDYTLNESKLPQVLEGSAIQGKVEIQWDPNKEENRFYKIEKTDANLTLVGQTLEVKQANYDSKTGTFDTKEATLKMDLGIFKGKELKGEEIGVDKNNKFTFSSLTLAHEEDFDFGIVTLTSKQLALKQKENRLLVGAEGKAMLNLPKALQPDANAELEGFIGLYLNDPSPFFELEKAKASITLANPLQELSKYLGEGWSKARFDLGATIPVFPGISAIFGVYIQLLAELPNKITGTAELKNKMLELDLELASKLEVEGGVYGGVQAGSQLLVALAVLLRAAAKMGIDLTVGYNKSFEVGDKAKKPDGEMNKNADGLFYSLSGELKAGAYLDLVATAFYFFQKTFTLELKEWSLGEFEFSNKQSKLPEGGEKSKFKEEDLRKEVTPEALKDAEVATMTAAQLLDQKQNERYSQKEKEEILTKITSAEAGRETQFNKAKQEKDKLKEAGGLAEGSESIFNDVAARNMQFMDKYIDKHINWEVAFKSIADLGSLSNVQPTNENKAKIKKTLMILKDVITIPGSFKDHYSALVQKFESAYKNSTSEAKNKEIKYLKNKALFLDIIHDFKVNILHSQFWGDESKIDSSFRDWSLYGKTNFENLTDKYLILRHKFHYFNEAYGFKNKEDNLSKALKEMYEEHQKKLEQKRASAQKSSSGTKE